MSKEPNSGHGSRSLRPAAIVAVLVACLLAGCGEESAQVLMMRGMQKAAAGDHAAALVLLDRAVARQPGDASLLIVRGGLHDTLGDPASALADYEAALVLAPELRPGLAEQVAYLREQVAPARVVSAEVRPETAAGIAHPVEAVHEPMGPTIRDVTFCSTEPRGFRDFDPQPDARYRAGDTVWIYLDVIELQARRRGDGGVENAFGQTLRLVDPAGNVLLDQVVQEGVRVVEPGHASDRFFLRNHINVPAHAPPGEYRVDLVVEDRLAGVTDEADGLFIIER